MHQQTFTQKPIVFNIKKKYIYIANPKAEAKAKARPGWLYIHTKKRIACAAKRRKEGMDLGSCKFVCGLD